MVRGSNVFVGRNGQGKTNLVEALAYLSDLSSHRVSTHQALIREGAESAVIRAQLQHGDRQILAELQLNKASPTRAQVNRSPVKTSEITRYFSCVMFAPEDLSLIRGDPSGRRRFLDDLLCQRSPRFRGVIADYDRVIRQRNALLKSGKGRRSSESALGTLELWDERLVALGVEIMQARSGVTAALSPLVASAYAEIAGLGQNTALLEQWSVMEASTQDDQTPNNEATAGSLLSDAFRSALWRVRARELERGISLVGPHRDDTTFTLNGLPARTHSSHGESWSFALALKLSAARLLRRESSTGDPVLILDDVFAELDTSRRARLGDAITDYEQVLITAAVFDDVPADLTSNVVRIHAGAIVDAVDGA